VLRRSGLLLIWFPFCDVGISHLDIHLVGLEVGFGCRKQGCVKGRKFSDQCEWLINAPLDLREALRDDAGVVLQGHPLRSSLNAEGHVELVVQNDSLSQLTHGELLDRACHCSLVGLGVLRVGSVGSVGGGAVSLQ
jgi:hypothetical protein